MHYRTPAIDFLGPADEFLAGSNHVERWPGAEGELTGHLDGPPVAVVPAPPAV